MRTLIIDKVDLREKFERLANDFAQVKVLLQGQGIFGALLTLGCDRVNADDASVWVLNAAEECLEVVLDRRPERQAFVGFKQPTNRGIVSMVAWNEHGISLSNVSEHEMFDDTADRTFRYQTRTMIALPVAVNGRVVGVLSAVNKRGADQFSDDDMNDLAIVVTSMGHVLRSQLLERLVQM
jgi:signal transduction protein with GAF and PtsI domain